MSNAEFQKLANIPQIPITLSYENGKECGRFRLEQNGLYAEVDQGGKTFVNWYCGYTRPVRRYEGKNGCGLDVEFKDRKGATKVISIEWDAIYNGGNAVQSQLAKAGLAFAKPTGRAAIPLINLYLIAFDRDFGESLPYAEVLDRGGWSPKLNAFVFENTTIGGEHTRLDAEAQGAVLTVRGTVDDWGKTMGLYASKSSVMRFAAYVALAAPLIQIVGQPTKIFHFFGERGTGKSTALYVAASIYGEKRNYVTTWNGTANSQTAKAMRFNNLVLCYDELKQGAQVLERAAYDLCNEFERGRANRKGGDKDGREWSLFLLSSGESDMDGIRQRTAHGAASSASGEHVRFIQVPTLSDEAASVDAKIGVFDVIDEETKNVEWRKRTVDAVRKWPCCGAVGAAFIGRLLGEFAAHGVDAFKAKADERMTRFIHSVGKVDSDEARVLSAFAVAAFAGELAHEWGLLPWGAGDAEAVVRKTFKAWRNSDASLSARESDILERVKTDATRYASYYDTIAPMWNNPARANGKEGIYGKIIKREDEAGDLVDCALILTTPQFDLLRERSGGLYKGEFANLLWERGLLVGNERGDTRGIMWRAPKGAGAIGLSADARYRVIRLGDAEGTLKAISDVILWKKAQKNGYPQS